MDKKSTFNYFIGNFSVVFKLIVVKKLHNMANAKDNSMQR